MWQITSQKNGVSAIGLQRVLGLGSYKTAWTVMHKLRRAMVRPGRERLRGVIEVDEAYWGGEEEDVRGRQTYDKALIAVAAEADGTKIGRIRLRHIQDCTRKTLHRFIAEAVEPASTVQSDGLQAYRELHGYVHQRLIQSHQPPDEAHLLPRVHRVISLLKRWLMGTHQGAISSDYLQDYLDEFTFRFNRRTSASRGKLFYRLAQQAVQTAPTTYDNLGNHNL
jgi:transposase-like protein